MKNLNMIFSQLILLFLFGTSAYAQGIYDIYGVTKTGGVYSKGNIFRLDYQGNNITNNFTFNDETFGGRKPTCDLALFNDKLYGTTSGGGLNNEGSIFEWNPNTNVYILRVALDPTKGINPGDGMILVNNKFYGVTQNGGTNNQGTLYEWDPVSNAYTVKYNFSEGATTGVFPRGKLTYVPANGCFYGLTTVGNAFNGGSLYKWNPITNTITGEVSFGITDIPGLILDRNPRGSLTLYNNKLYGTTAGTTTGGSLFEFDPLNNPVITGIRNYKYLSGFNSLRGTNPYGGVAAFNNKLYGLAQTGGLNDAGTIFEYDILTASIAKKIDLGSTGNQGFAPKGNNLLLIGNKFYGISSFNGIVFEYDPVNNIYAEKNTLQYDDGIKPLRSLSLYNNKLYVTTSEYGGAFAGSIVEWDYQTNILTKKKAFGCIDGSGVQSPLIKNEQEKLYGTTETGGTYNEGVFFEYNQTTNTVTKKVSFGNGLGIFNPEIRNPIGSLAVVSGLAATKKYYGIATKFNDISSTAALYSFNPTNNLLVAHFEMTNANGINAYGGLMKPDWSSNLIYGLAHDGGANNFGVLFEYNAIANTYTKKYEFSNFANAGKNPSGILVGYNNKLYGLTENGGAGNNGVIFEYNPATNIYTKKLEFGNTVGGSKPTGSLVLFGDIFYGYTSEGGANSKGVLFSWDADQNIYTKLYDFTLNDGGTPKGTPTLNINGDKLYGVTKFGGVSNTGVVFEFDLTTNVFTKKAEFNQLNGNQPDINNDLILIPAKVASGFAGLCQSQATINNTTAQSFLIPITDNIGNAIAELNTGNNLLGNIDVSLYKHNSLIRIFNGRKYLNRNVTIAVQNQPTSPVEVSIYITKEEYETLKLADNSIITPANLELVKNSDACSASISSGLTILNTTFNWWGGPDSNIVLKVNVNSFSTFYVRAKSGVLPLQFLSFNAALVNKIVKLNWITSNEINTKSFDVEYSIDGIHFNKIGTVQALSNVGINNYTFDNTQLLSAKNYYRLKQIDNDGKFIYSNIILLNKVGDSNQWSVFPNPVNNTLYAQNTAIVKNVKAILINSDGKILLTKNIVGSSNHFDIDVKTIPVGLYMLKIIDGTKIEIIKIIRQ